MNKISITLFALACPLLFTNYANAQSVIVHMQGEEGDREIYFADIAVISDRTPPSMIVAETEIKELEVTVIYENANKPEWATLRIQFECPSQVHYVIEQFNKKKEVKEYVNLIKKDASAKFRIVGGSYIVRRSDLKNEPMNISDWNISDSPMLMKSFRIACNEVEFQRSVNKGVNKDNKNDFNYNIFNKEVEKFDLPPNLYLTGYSLPTEFLDFAWYLLWSDKKRPDPSGKWSKKATKEEKAAAIAEFNELKKQADPLIAAAKKSAEIMLAKMDEEEEFRKRADKIQGDRGMSRNEKLLNSVWLGEPEEKIVNKMGMPMRFNEFGQQRHLGYTKIFDNRGAVIDVQSGAIVGQEGIYSECNVEFVTITDNKNMWRVADVRLISDSTIGYSSLSCDALLHVPD